MRTFITGINGFVGEHLTRALKKRGDSVWGICHPSLDPDSLCREFADLKVKPQDLLDFDGLYDWIRRAKPQRIYHLAAQSHVPTSWADPAETFKVNVLGTINLMRASAGLKNPPGVLLVSSGDVYGNGSSVMGPSVKGPLKETSPINPLNPYAASKAGAEIMARTLAMADNIPLVIVRPFNHIGPGQSPAFVTGDFARQIARIEAGLAKPVVKVGDLEASKDFTDVRDMVEAYILALEKCPPGEVFNLCSGRTYFIKKILDILIEASHVNPKIVQQASRMRSTKSPVIKAGGARFKKLTGWKPKYSLKQSLRDILDYWRERVKDGD